MRLLYVIMFIILMTIGVLANEENKNDKVQINKKALIIVDEILEANEMYLKGTNKEKFISIMTGQSPRITLLSCSDSRVQNTAFDATPENDLFIIRNIGNQLSSNEGSVAYGINHLNTLVLLIMGHSRCGAIKATMSDYSAETSSIRREISTLSLSIANSCSKDDPDAWIKNTINNVRKQVKYALQDYQEKVNSGELVIVGAVFDFANDMKKGHGKLNIIDINGKSVEK